MASVFLSYDREDGGKARSIATALEKAGHTVWWDLHVRGGTQFAKAIEQALREADAVVVLWSMRSVESGWVRDEAAAGRDAAKLVPVTIDGTEPPLGFRQYQSINLARWKGQGRAAEFQQVLHAIDGLGSGSTSRSPPPISPGVARWSRPRVRVVAGLIVAAILIAGAFAAFRLYFDRSSVPAVAVAAADGSATSSRLAQDLLVRLGALRTANLGALRLYGTRERPRQGLMLQVAASTGPSARASLVLTDARDQSLLWSKEFELPAAREPDLRPLVASSASELLRCALDLFQHGKGKISQEISKLYLQACAGFEEASFQDINALIPTLHEVTQRAPRFIPGWAKLVLAESLGHGEGEDAPRELRDHIAVARRLEPHLPEAYLAEASLLPASAFTERLRLLELAVERAPSNPQVHGALAQALRSVGRMRDAVESAMRESELDPLSASARNDYISALIYMGNFDAAREEIERADRLWPGTNAVLDARFRLDLRYGDARKALEAIRAGQASASRETRSFIAARIDPTPANIERAIADVEALRAQRPVAIMVTAQAMAAFGREKDLFPLLIDWKLPAISDQMAEVLFRPAFREFRRDPRFMIVAKRLGLVDYWRKSGKWPDFCFEPNMPYDCKAEAAKLMAGRG